MKTHRIEAGHYLLEEIIRGLQIKIEPPFGVEYDFTLVQLAKRMIAPHSR